MRINLEMEIWNIGLSMLLENKRIALGSCSPETSIITDGMCGFV